MGWAKAFLVLMEVLGALWAAYQAKVRAAREVKGNVEEAQAARDALRDAGYRARLRAKFRKRNLVSGVSTSGDGRPDSGGNSGTD